MTKNAEKNRATFFTDENLSHYLALMIAQFDRDNDIVPHRDKFEKGTPDEVWIPEAAKWNPKPIALIGDGRILRTPALKLIAKESGLTFVVMGESFMRTAWEDQAWKFVKAWPEIVKQSKGVRQPTIFDLGISNLKVTPRHLTSEIKVS